MMEALIERAARRLCEKRGEDPDRMTMAPCDCGDLMCQNGIPTANWKLAAEEVNEFMQIHQSILESMT